MTRADIENFFKTLILGDFEEHQNTSAQLIGGLISLIPVLDQVMDVRDVSGALFNINKRGGFAHASSEQLVNLGFAALGTVPEVGSAFKTVFKPLWKERRAAKGAVHGGVEAIEALLGMRRGGAIAWVRTELLGRWPARTQEVIAAVNAALAAAIELTTFIATAGGWKDWLVPDPVQAMAKELLPGLQAMQGRIDVPMQRASAEIREFVADLLGEQAASVVMSVGQRAATASALPGTRARSGHNAADARPSGSVPARQPDQKVSQQHKADAQRGAGPVHSAVQRTRKAFADLATREKGLVGEHVADYHEVKRLGGGWGHDRERGQWSPATVHKLNADQRPVNLSLKDLPKVNQPGIDAVWEHAGRHTVTEAKASESIAVAYAFGKHKEKKGWIPIVTGINPDLQLLHYLLSDSSDKQGVQSPLMQMGKAWVRDRAPREQIELATVAKLQNNDCYRRVLLVTLESPGSLDHAQALADAHSGKTGNEMHAHLDHSITREWEAAEIDAVDKARERAHVAKRSPEPPTGPTGSKSKKK